MTKLIGVTSGSNPDDLRCLGCVDFSDPGRLIYTGEDFSCTYCGDEWKSKQCDHCATLVPAGDHDGVMCKDCKAVALDILPDPNEPVINVEVIVSGFTADVVVSGLVILELPPVTWIRHRLIAMEKIRATLTEAGITGRIVINEH